MDKFNPDERGEGGGTGRRGGGSGVGGGGEGVASQRASLGREDTTPSTVRSP